jgi:hypothetical protein
MRGWILESRGVDMSCLDQDRIAAGWCLTYLSQAATRWYTTWGVALEAIGKMSDIMYS